MKKIKHWLIGMGAMVLTAGSPGAAWAEEGLAERAGKQIDKVVEMARKQIKDLVEEEGPAERAGKQIDETAAEARERIERLAQEEGPMEQTGRKIDETVQKARERIEAMLNELRSQQ